MCSKSESGAALAFAGALDVRALVVRRITVYATAKTTPATMTTAPTTIPAIVPADALLPPDEPVPLALPLCEEEDVTVSAGSPAKIVTFAAITPEASAAARTNWDNSPIVPSPAARVSAARA